MSAPMDDTETRLALRARLEAVAEIPPPADRAWTQVNFVPSATRPHIESKYNPGPRPVLTLSTANGYVEAGPTFFVDYYGLANRGEEPIEAVAAAILAAFTPGTVITLPSGNRLHIGWNPAPFPSPILPAPANKALVSITIPCVVQATNTVS